MAVSRKQKESVVATLTADLGEAGSVILTDFTGINVEDLTELRAQMRKHSVNFTVVKNTLLRRIFNEIEVGTDEGIYAMMEGPTALAYSTDEVLPIKIIRKFAENHKGLPLIKGGFVSGETYEISKLIQLADIPSRDELLAKLLGSASSPLRDFVSVSSGIIQKLIFAVNAIRKSKEN